MHYIIYIFSIRYSLLYSLTWKVSFERNSVIYIIKRRRTLNNSNVLQKGLSDYIVFVDDKKFVEVYKG